jgi:transformation/transcription domain-associated protein
MNPVTTTPDFEYQIWESECVRCAENMNQWSELTEYVKSTQDPSLALECSWRIGDWETARNIISGFEQKDSFSTSLQKLRLSIQDTFFKPHISINGSVEELKDLHELSEQALNEAIVAWTKYPRLPSSYHVSLLSSFQQLVELQESIEMLAIVQRNVHNSSSVSSTLAADLKSYTLVWRERLPNEWESLPFWTNLFTWRNHMFFLINNYIKLNDISAVSSEYHDTAWNIIKFAEIARKQQLPTVCLSALKNLSELPFGLEPHEQFAQVCEQVRVCIGLPNEFQAAVNIINGTDIDLFNDEQKAELLSLKGESLKNLGLGEESHNAF